MLGRNWELKQKCYLVKCLLTQKTIPSPNIICKIFHASFQVSMYKIKQQINKWEKLKVLSSTQLTQLNHGIIPIGLSISILCNLLLCLRVLQKECFVCTNVYSILGFLLPQAFCEYVSLLPGSNFPMWRIWLMHPNNRLQKLFFFLHQTKGISFYHKVAGTLCVLPLL